ncbi:hypothetical protein AB0K82_43945, partial [Actinoallomurus sp. NPDC052274]
EIAKSDPARAAYLKSISSENCVDGYVFRAGDPSEGVATGPPADAAVHPSEGVEPPAGAAVGPPEDDAAAGERVAAALRTRGYEPYREGAEVRLRNCPFHALAVEFPPLVCGMNLALLEGLLEGLEPTGMVARMDPRPGECCVMFASKNNND